MRWLSVRICKGTSGPDDHTGLTSGPVRFRKHHRPCGQPAVVGGIESIRPLPAQAGHFTRINAMPSDLPLTSTDWAMYPVPPQRGQLFGSTPPPRLPRSLSPIRVGDATKLILLRKPNKPNNPPPQPLLSASVPIPGLLSEFADKYAERLQRELAALNAGIAGRHKALS